MNKRLKNHKENLFERLSNPEYAAEYLTAAFEDKDLAGQLLAIRNVIEANEGMASIANQIGAGRTSFYKAMGETGNPQFDTVSKTLNAMGLHFSVQTSHA